MSAYETTLGLRITLDSMQADNLAIGLYNDSGASCFRWILTRMDGTVLSWKTGMLATVGAIEESADWRLGGTPTQLGNVAVTFSDHISSCQFWKTLDDLGIALAGLKAEIVEFRRETSTGIVSELIAFYGEVDTRQYSETEYSIAVVSSEYKRKANIAFVIDPIGFPDASTDLQGKIVPVTFGRFDNGRYAKFLRTADAKSELSNYWFTGGSPDVVVFPVVAISGSPDNVTIKLKSGDLGVVIDNVQDTWIVVVDGDGVGQQRQITRFIGDTTYGQVIVVFSDVFMTALSASGSTQSWVKFVVYKRMYNAENWPCKGFVTTAGIMVSIPELWAYDGKYSRIPQYAYKSVTTDANKDRVHIDASLFTGGDENVKGFLILPVLNPALCALANLTDWGYPTFDKIVDGIFKPSGGGASISIASGALTDITDGVAVSKIRYAITGLAQSDRIMFAFEFGMPMIDSSVGMDFDKAYIGIKYAINAIAHGPIGNCGINHDIKWRRFLGVDHTIFSKEFLDINPIDDALWTIDNLPDFYYSPPPSTMNLNFYRVQDSVNTVHPFRCLTSGYSLPGFELAGITKDNSKQIDKMVLLAWLSAGQGDLATTLDFNVDIFEMAMIFERSMSIKSDLWIPFRGRAFADTWGARKSSSAACENLIDVIEMIERLQNWSEVGGAEPTAGWGKGYSPGALIDISADEGGFDNANLADQRAISVARQLLNYDDAWTDSLIASLCRSGFLATYTKSFVAADEAGKVSLSSILVSSTPVNALTLADSLADAEIGSVTEPAHQDVFCEPFVNYAYDQGAGKYSSRLAITHVSAATWATAYTPGFTGSDGEVLWNLCHALWLKDHHVEQAPSEMTDQPWIYRYADALWFLTSWIAWMGKRRISFTTSYEKARLYHIAEHLSLTLPHQTNNMAIEVVIEKITKDLQANRVDLRLVMLDPIGGD